MLRHLILSVLLVLLAAPVAASDGRVIFADDFRGHMTQLPDGTRKLYPDRSRWAFNFLPGSRWPDSYGDGTNWLEGNGESQVYLSPFTGMVRGRVVPLPLRYDPFTITPEGLEIKAAELSAEQQRAYQVGGHRRFGSGLLRSHESFTYGRIRLIAKLPDAPGTWPAFWLLPKAFVWPPEIDVFEGMVWGKHTEQIHIGLVTRKGEQDGIGQWEDLGVNPSQGFHEYGVDWTEQEIIFYFDGRELARQPTPPSFRQPMYLLINVAVGGKWVCNELGIRPIDSMAPERLSRCADSFAAGLPGRMIIRSVTVQDITYR